MRVGVAAGDAEGTAFGHEEGVAEDVGHDGVERKCRGSDGVPLVPGGRVRGEVEIVGQGEAVARSHWKDLMRAVAVEGCPIDGL